MSLLSKIIIGLAFILAVNTQTIDDKLKCHEAFCKSIEEECYLLTECKPKLEETLQCLFTSFSSTSAPFDDVKYSNCLQFDFNSQLYQKFILCSREECNAGFEGAGATWTAPSFGAQLKVLFPVLIMGLILLI